MVVVLLAPVLVVNPQCTRLTPARASVRTSPESTPTVYHNVIYDLAGSLFPPESSPSSLPTSP
jgi:hypothetical protein